MSARSKLMCGVISGLIVGLVGIASGSFLFALTEDRSSDYHADSGIGVKGKILKNGYTRWNWIIDKNS